MSINSLPLLVGDVMRGQPYEDVPVYAKPNMLRNAIRSVAGIVSIHKILLEIKHFKLKWLKPDGTKDVQAYLDYEN